MCTSGHKRAVCALAASGLVCVGTLVCIGAWKRRGASLTCRQGGGVAVVTVIKNEHDIFAEWVSHYADEGVDAVYAIDNNSTPPMTVPPGAAIPVTIVRDASKHAQTRLLEQAAAHARKAGHVWVLSVDVDEFVWPTQGARGIPDVLSAVPCSCAAVTTETRRFGDSNLRVMPPSIRIGFTHRAPRSAVSEEPKWAGRLDRISGMGVHHPRLAWWDSAECATELVSNHYLLLTRERFLRVKATRGDVNAPKWENVRSIAYFNSNNRNDIADTGLRTRIVQRRRVLNNTNTQIY